MKYDHYGLRYKPNAKSPNKMMKMRKEKRIASLVGASVKGKHMVFPHIRETFYSVVIQHNDIKPSGASNLKGFEMLFVNAIEDINVKDEDVRAMVRPMSFKVTPKNWTATDIPTFFQTFTVINLKKLLPLPKGKEYLLCMGLLFKEIKIPF